MFLLLIRHAIAEDRLEFARTGAPDAHRPLSEKGRRRMAAGAAGLRSMIPTVDVLATSPLTRAEQTAEIVAEAWDLPGFEVVESLATGDGDTFLDWLRGRGEATVAAVGHEPHLSEWTSRFLAGSLADFLVLKKGSALLLEFPGEVAPGAAWLHWALTPRQLRRLADDRSGD